MFRSSSPLEKIGKTTVIFSLALGMLASSSSSLQASSSIKSYIKSFFHHNDNGEGSNSDANTVALKDPVAIVNGNKISKDKVEEYFSKSLGMAGMKPSALPEAQKIRFYHQIVEQLIMEELLNEKANDIKVSDEEVKDQLDLLKKQMATSIKGFDKLSADEKNKKLDAAFNDFLKKQDVTLDKVNKEIKDQMSRAKWAANITKGKAEVTEADAKKFYDQNIKRFEAPERVRASHILFMVPQGAAEDVAKKKEKEAEDAIARAKKGEDFSKLASELSEDPTAKQNGGDLDYFAKGQMLPEFSEAAFSQKIGSISDKPIKTRFGYHVIKVTDKKPPGTLSFSQVKDDIINMLKNQKTNKLIGDEIEKARQSSKIEIFLPPLPPPSTPAPAVAPKASATPAAVQSSPTPKEDTTAQPKK